MQDNINTQTQKAIRPVLSLSMEMYDTWSIPELEQVLEDLEEAYLLSTISNNSYDRDKFLVFRRHITELINIIDGTTEDDAKYTCEFILTLCKKQDA